MSALDSEPLMVWLDSDLAHSKSPVDDIPEWRRPNGGGAILQSGPRRKPYEEEPLGNAFSTSYPPRPSGPWVEQNGPVRPPHDRLVPNGPPGRWDRNGERDRERGRVPQEWDADEGGTCTRWSFLVVHMYWHVMESLWHASVKIVFSAG